MIRFLYGALLAISLPAAVSAAPVSSSSATGETSESAPSSAIGLRGTYQWVPPELMSPQTPVTPAEAGVPLILYMNRHGGTYTPGYNNSSTNSSSIVRGTSQISPWQVSDQGWQQVMDCVTFQFSEFNIVVTDEDPGDVAHVESVVAGHPSDIGMQGAGGVSPFSCTVLDRSIVFTFAELFGADYRLICEVVAQEVAHSFGLDHEYLCEDPMTYLTGCGLKEFQDQAAPCGEFSQRECSCGGSTQNSVQMMLDRLGPADAVPPSLVVDSPRSGDEVEAGFEVQVTASDDKTDPTVKIYIDGKIQETLLIAPYAAATPADLPSGIHFIRVNASDGRNKVNEELRVLVRGADMPESCQRNAECPSGFECASGTCSAEVEGYADGDLGAWCRENSHCDSDMCAFAGDRGRCVASCDADSEGSCPDGFECVGPTGSSLCWPEEKSSADNSGCAAAGSSTAPLSVLFLAGLAAAARRRRRRRMLSLE